MEVWLDRRNSSTKNLDEKGFDRVVTIEPEDCLVVQVKDDSGQQRARSAIGSVDWVLVELDDWKMIPLENLVSAAQGSPTRIAALIDEPSQIQGAAFALQIGVDALLVPENEKVVEAAFIAKAQRLERLSEEQFPEHSGVAELGSVRVTTVQNAGVGDRVCIDLTSLLAKGEGLMVGPSSSSMVLVHGETIDSEFVPVRPFRVNAGTVHAYTLLADGSTAYLSELEAGDSVMVFSKNGDTREASIGRLKIERRPMILLKWVDENDNEAQAVLQQAETVRMVSPVGDAIAITEIKKGDMLISRIDSGARHIGQKVDAEIKER